MKPIHRFVTAITLIAATACAALMMLAGCASSGGIAPHAQKLDVAALLPDAGAPVDVSDNWWKALDDERLNALMDRALAASPTLAVARTRI